MADNVDLLDVPAAPAEPAANPEANPAAEPNQEAPAPAPADDAGSQPKENPTEDVGNPEAQEKEPEEVKPEPKELDVDTSVLSESTTALIDVLQSTGTVDVQDVLETAKTALAERDETKLIPELFELKYGENAKAALAVARSIIRDTKARITEVQQVVYKLAGGEDLWNALARDFKTTADTKTVEAVRMLLNSQHFETAYSLMQQTVQGSTKVPHNNGTLKAGSAAVTSGLTAEEFQKEFTLLKKEANGASLDSGVFGEKFKQLVARRQLGMKSGR